MENSGPLLTAVNILGDFTFYTATCSTAWLESLTSSIPIVLTHTLCFRIIIITHTCSVGTPISTILLPGSSASPPRLLIPSLPHTCSLLSRPRLFLSAHFPLLPLPYFLPDPVQTSETIPQLHRLDLQQPQLSAFPQGAMSRKRRAEVEQSASDMSLGGYANHFCLCLRRGTGMPTPHVSPWRKNTLGPSLFLP